MEFLKTIAVGAFAVACFGLLMSLIAGVIFYLPWVSLSILVVCIFYIIGAAIVGGGIRNDFQ